MNIFNKAFEQISSKYVVEFGLKLTVMKKELIQTSNWFCKTGNKKKTADGSNISYGSTL